MSGSIVLVGRSFQCFSFFKFLKGKVPGRRIAGVPHFLRVARITNCTRIAKKLSELLRIASELPPELLNELRWVDCPSGRCNAVDTLLQNIAHGATVMSVRCSSLEMRDASIQPGSLQEVMLHEVALAWMRDRLVKTTPQRAWQETVEEYCTRLKACAAYINDNYAVHGPVS